MCLRGGRPLSLRKETSHTILVCKSTLFRKECALSLGIRFPWTVKEPS